MTWIIVGLGNPGQEYENTRHNAGRMAVEHYASKHGVKEWRSDAKAVATVAKIGTHLCVLPDTFMNKSGSAVSKYVKNVKAAHTMIVVYDDLDLPIGTIKLSYDRGSGGHKGLDSIMTAVKTREFTRIRIGVTPATPGGKLKKPHGGEVVNTFILGSFKPAEMNDLKKVYKIVHDAIEVVMEKGPLVAMGVFNTR